MCLEISVESRLGTDVSPTCWAQGSGPVVKGLVL